MLKFIKIPSNWITLSILLTILLVSPIVFIIYNAIGAQSDTLIHLKETVLNDYISKKAIPVIGKPLDLAQLKNLLWLLS